MHWHCIKVSKYAGSPFMCTEPKSSNDDFPLFSSFSFHMYCNRLPWLDIYITSSKLFFLFSFFLHFHSFIHSFVASFLPASLMTFWANKSFQCNAFRSLLFYYYAGNKKEHTVFSSSYYTHYSMFLQVPCIPTRFAFIQTFN